MRSVILKLCVLAAGLAFFPQAARADYVLWEDPATGLTMTWPDTWKIVSNADEEDIVTVMAPGGRGHPSCRVRENPDARYLVYPPRYSWAVQHVAYSQPFWERYLAEYSNAEIDNFADDAGLGRGFASVAVASYESAVQGPDMRRKALLLGTVYNGTAYVLECSSHRDAYDRWEGMFLSIAKSVDFRKAHYELRSGHYRNFMADPRIEFKGDEGHSRELY